MTRLGLFSCCFFFPRIIPRRYDRKATKMKGALLTAAVLLGSAQAGGVHKLKLKKVPLAEQMVRHSLIFYSPHPSLVGEDVLRR